MQIISRTNQLSSKSRQKEFYSGFTTNFDMNPSTGALIVLTNEESVKQSLKNLIQTDLGSRHYNNDIGSSIRRSLFEPIDDPTASTLQKSIELTIRNYEPRAQNPQILVIPNIVEQYYSVKVFFNLINIPNQQFDTEVILNRIR